MKYEVYDKIAKRLAQVKINFQKHHFIRGKPFADGSL